MQDVKIFKSLFPIRCGNYRIEILSLRDMDWYIDNLRKDYYNKNLDFNFKRDITKKAIKIRIYDLVKEYSLDINSDGELRVLMKNESANEIVSGCTLHKHEKSIELGYFTVPKHQNKGLSSLLLKTITQKVSRGYTDFEYFKAVVHKDNYSSIRVLNKVGFNLTEEYKGSKTINQIYTLERYKSCS